MKYVVSGSRNSPPIRQTGLINEQMLIKSTDTGLDNERKDHIDPKDPSKETAPNNYRLITCLPMMWRILIAQIRENIYYSLTSRRLFLTNRKDATKDPEAQQNYFT